MKRSLFVICIVIVGLSQHIVDLLLTHVWLFSRHFQLQFVFSLTCTFKSTNTDRHNMLGARYFRLAKGYQHGVFSWPLNGPWGNPGSERLRSKNILKNRHLGDVAEWLQRKLEIQSSQDEVLHWPRSEFVLNCL